MEFINLNGICFTSTSLEEIKIHIRRCLLARPDPQFWITYNNNIITPQYKLILEKADLIFSEDSKVIKSLEEISRVAINPISGKDILNLFLQSSDSIDIKAAFVCSSLYNLSDFINPIKEKYTKLKISASVCLPDKFENNVNYTSNLIEELKTSKLEVLVLSFEDSLKYDWFREHIKEIGARINIGVGKLFF